MAGIDTACLWLPGTECGGIDLMREIPKHLSDMNEFRGIKDGREYARIDGKLGNLFVKVYPYGVRVENSLCKYYFGNNFQTLTCELTQKTMERMSDELHLPMRLAKIKRFDVGANLITKFPPYLYLPILGSLNCFRRMGYPGGVMYANRGKTQEVIFYDKIMECVEHGGSMPESFSGRNILRLETRNLKLTSGIRRTMGFDPITAATLYDEKFYNQINRMMLTTYYAIGKMKNVKEPDFNVKKIKEFNILALARVIQKDFKGLARFEEVIEFKRMRGELNSSQKHNLIKKARDAMRHVDMITEPDRLVEELDGLVEKETALYK